MARTVITPPQGIGLPSGREVWEAREVLWRFGTRDILLRYRQTAVGVAWVILQPLAAAGIFAIIFGQVADLPSNGVPYFVFSFAGLLGWNLLGGIVDRASASLVANQSLVSKVFFPRLLVPFATALSVLLDFAVAFGLFVVLLFVFGINPGWPILLLPVWMAVGIAIAMGVGIAASSLMVKYRDVGYVLPWLMQILFFATPVAYSLEAVPPDLMWVFASNPLTWLMEAYRWSLLGLQAPPLWQIGALIVTAVLVFTGGLLVFQKFERGFADVI
jgi:lipopolysaccharide transport system permease protein